MSTPLPTDGAPAAPPTEPAAPVGQTPTEPAIHPAWEKAMEAIPDMLRGPIVAQIRETDRNAQQAIEQARSNGVPQEWSDFLGSAQAAGLSPNQLVEAWTNSQAIQQDPVGFSILLNDIIDQRMALPASDPDHLSKREGYRAKAEAAAEVAAATGLTPEGGLQSEEDIRVAKLERELAELRTGFQQQTEQATEAQIIAQEQVLAQQYADRFIAAVTTAVPQLPGEAPEVNLLRQSVARNADSLLQGDPNRGQLGGLSPEKAVEFAVASLKQAGMPFPTAPAAGQAPPPVGGGNQLPVPVPTQFPKGDGLDARNARAAAMIAAGQAALQD